MKWTPAQQETIEARGKNILVSAAAGSGKTTVLIERIKQLVLQDRIDIDRFLITTFTKAAATEMKEKMERAIRGEIERVSAAGKGADGLNSSRQTASAGADGRRLGLGHLRALADTDHVGFLLRSEGKRKHVPVGRRGIRS